MLSTRLMRSGPLVAAPPGARRHHLVRLARILLVFIGRGSRGVEHVGQRPVQCCLIAARGLYPGRGLISQAVQRKQ